MKIEHKGLNVTADVNKDFTQTQLETYQETLLEKSKEYKSGAAYNRVMVEAAQEAKILTGVEGDLTRPPVVKWLTLKVISAMDEATTIPPE
jgi:hypothetical protein